MGHKDILKDCAGDKSKVPVFKFLHGSKTCIILHGAGCRSIVGVGLQPEGVAIGGLFRICNYHYFAEQIAAILGTDINLVALKVSELIRRGHQFNGLGYRSDFLKN